MPRSFSELAIENKLRQTEMDGAGSSRRPGLELGSKPIGERNIGLKIDKTKVKKGL